MIFCPIPFQSDQRAPQTSPETEERQRPEEVQVTGDHANGMVGTVQGIAKNYLKRFFNPTDVSSFFPIYPKYHD